MHLSVIHALKRDDVRDLGLITYFVPLPQVFHGAIKRTILFCTQS